jgi:hypothetical protein
MKNEIIGAFMLKIGLYGVVAVLLACCTNSFLKNAKVSAVTSKLLVCESKVIESYLEGYRDGQKFNFDDNGSGRFIF